MNTIGKVCVYCGSSDKIAEPYHAAARDMGRALAAKGMTLVFGGGRTGLMGALADAALEGGATVIGVIPKGFNTPQLVHPSLTHLRVVDTMHERKAHMAELADAFVALPGGLGTLEELFEILTWAQVGLHRKPVGVLNTLGYFNPLHTLIEHADSQGFIYSEHSDLLISDEDPESLIQRLIAYEPPKGLKRWVHRQEEAS